MCQVQVLCDVQLLPGAPEIKRIKYISNLRHHSSALETVIAAPRFRKGKKGGKQTVVHEFDPSGGMTGNYSMVHQPWPTTWNVYLIRNYQMNSDAFYFNEAGTSESGSYDAVFQVTDFTTTGTIAQMSDNVTWALNPNLNSIFSFTRM